MNIFLLYAFKSNNLFDVYLILFPPSVAADAFADVATSSFVY